MRSPTRIPARPLLTNKIDLIIERLKGNNPMLTLYRTPIVLGSSPGARVCFVEVTTLVPPEHDGATGYEAKLGTWPAIENADDSDKMPVGSYELVMTRMSKSQRPALWLPGTELFVHGLASGDQWAVGIYKHVGRARYLKGCAMPGWNMDSHGLIAEPDHAMQDIFEALGGFKDKKRVPFRCVELGELPATRYEVVEILDPSVHYARLANGPSDNERWRPIPDGGVLVEREVK